MSSLAFPLLAKKAKLSDGTTYGYVAVCATDAAKPTFLLLHGYPSSCYDWRHQIKQLAESGYGVIAPDLLGYGDTDKPVEVEAYSLKAMSFHMRDILDLERVSKCIAVSHDWGGGLASRLANYIPERLHGMVMLSVGYNEPGFVWDIDAIDEFTRQLVGYPTYGYWAWHNTEEAVNDCDSHPASAFTLLYAADPEDWKINLAPIGAAARYVRANKVDALPSWYSLQEYTIRDRIFARGGHRGPLSWYKAAMRGINLTDEASFSGDARLCQVPVLLVVSDKDYVTRADVQILQSKKWVPDLHTETLDCGHWIQLERPDQLYALLEKFARDVAANNSSE